MNIGIFGGSFNPIHIGHLIAAEEVFQQRALSKIIFVPTGISPHKDTSNLIAPAHRYQMIKEAIGDNDHFELSDVETKRPGRSYTVDTIRTFKEMYGEENHLYLIVGTDMINDISTWKDVDVLSRLCSFIVIDRFPVPLQEAAGADKPRGIAIFSTEKRREIERLKVTIPPIGVSSSEIRDRLKRGAGVRYLVPRCVEDYIMRNGLYGKGASHEEAKARLAIDLPEDVFSALRLAPREFANEMRIAAAVQWYGERRVSQGKAAEIAGISRVAFVDELRRRHVSAIQIDAEELDAELGQ